MQDIKRKITEKEYNRLIQLSQLDLNKEISKTIPIEWACGYGWYGCCLKKERDEYYIIHTIGSSCD